jgi:AcrR family transcriptional regulator
MLTDYIAVDIKSPKRRGRPREFDQAKALDRALELFWRQGYEGTSIADLTAAIGITPPSLYAAFGSKEQLYYQVLQRYRASVGRCFATALAEEPTAYAAVERFLSESARIFGARENPSGCLISSGILSCAPENNKVAETVASMRTQALQAIRRRLQAGVKSGELPRDTDVTQLARFYGAVVQGMSVQARDCANAKTLRSIAEIALRAWPVRGEKAS